MITEVVPCDISLLLSKAPLKTRSCLRLGERHSNHVERTALEVRSSRKTYEIKTPKVIHMRTMLAITENMTEEQKHKTLLKLHKQFGRVSLD